MATTVWLELGDKPAVAFYFGRRPPLSALPALYYPTLAELGKLRRVLQENAETVNISVAFDNSLGETLGLITRLSSTAKIKYVDNDDTVQVLFEGELQALPAGDQRLSATITSKALLSPLKLRPGSRLPAFSDTAKLPRVQGEQVSIKPLVYTPDGTEWLCNDGPLSRIRAVYDGDTLLPAESYALDNRADGTGRVLGLLLLAQPPESPTLITAIVDGEPDPQEVPVAGSLPRPLTNPAKLARYLLGELTDAEYSSADFDRFRRETSEIKLRGVITGEITSAQDLLTAIAKSCGARFSAGAASLFRRWPPSRGLNDFIAIRLTERLGYDVVSQPLAQFSELTVNYAYDWSLNAYTKAITLAAPNAKKQIGVVTETLDLPFIGDDAVAEQIGRARLSYYAAGVYQVTWTAVNSRAIHILPGHWAEVNHPHSALTGIWPLVECNVDPLTSEIDFTVEGHVNSLETVTVVRRSLRQSVTSRAVQIKRQAGAASIQINDPETGQPLAGAQVVVDGRVFITDATGLVTVSGVTSGQTLEITVTPIGGEPFTVTQTVS